MAWPEKQNRASDSAAKSLSHAPGSWSRIESLNFGAAWSNFYVLLVGATMLYVGGMYLNDAFDAEFDQQHRTERPVPAGNISRRTVWQIGITLLVLGWLCLAMLGLVAAVAGLLLVGSIVLYDAIHKRTAFAPLLMAACRFLLYVVAAAATLRPVSHVVIAYGLGLAAYITGLSYLARVESAGSLASRWPAALLFTPCAVAVWLSTVRGACGWLVLAGFVAWTVWCLRGVLFSGPRNVGRTVAGLLAGIVLVDWLSQIRPSDQIIAVFASLFVITLLLQRKVPAT